MKIAICTNDREKEQKLKELLNEIFLGNAEIAEYTAQGIFYPEVTAFEEDLLFLDTEVDGEKGIEIARKLRDANYSGDIVFIADDSSYAMEGFEVEAAGYLVDINKDTLTAVMNRISQRDKFQKVRIAVLINGQHRYPYIHDIMYVESDKHSVLYHLKDGEVLKESGKLNDKELVLTELSQMQVHKRDVFCRYHQSYLVNVAYIDEIYSDQIVMENGEIIPVSRSRSSASLLAATRAMVHVFKNSNRTA